MPQTQNIIGLVYDFDKTLSPNSMQEDTVLPYLGIEPAQFWAETDRKVAEDSYEAELAWMQQLLEVEAFRKLSNQDLRNMGLSLKYYPGVPEIFQQLEAVLDKPAYKEYGVTVEHYIITSGLREIVEGSNLRRYVKSIFGSEIAEDAQGKLGFPKRAISHTQKTQYLFRINKGYLDLQTDVNDHVSREDHRIPFQNMLYIGDGPTDVPCFAVMSQQEGHTLAVYDPSDTNSFAKCMQLRKAKRVEEIAEANYQKGTHLWRLIEYVITEIADGIVQRRRDSQEASIISAPGH
jgi:phosphoglycolate phosphatase-like HAD superfamily hydrolase